MNLMREMKHRESFPLGHVRLERTAPRRGKVMAPFTFVSPTLGRVRVDKGFETDYASVPRIFWSLYPPDGEYTDAAVIHDFLYRSQTSTRAEADHVFLEAMAASGVPWHRRHILHKAVRIGGWITWIDNRRQRLAEIINENKAHL